MRYYQEEKTKKKFIRNGHSIVRVEEVLQMNSPAASGRVIRVFEVQEIIHASPGNDIVRGHHIPLSFPSELSKCKEYTWYRNGKWEECQVPLVIKDRKANTN